MILRYEDFIVRPQQSIKRILDFVREKKGSLPSRGERQVNLKITHTVSGNPSRFGSGIVELRPDDEWKIRMKGSDRKIVTGLTGRLLMKYGYDS